MKIRVICAALPPQLDGIGDYTAHLAAELARSANVTVLTGAPTPDPISDVRVKTAFSVDDPRSVWKLVDHVAADAPDWVLLQYNPFSYGRWGLNLHLPRVMRQIKRCCPGTKFALMVHEPFVPIISPQFAVMATWQRWQLWALGQEANVLFFAIDFCTRQFKDWFPHKRLIHLPVGSNIPLVPISRQEARGRLGISDETVVLGLFGTASSGRMLDRVKGALTTLRVAGTPVQLLYVGPHSAEVCDALGSNDIIAAGPFLPEEVSRRLSAMDIYLAAYIDGVSTRRGAFIASLQHGIATVGTCGPLTDALLEQKDRQAFLLADVASPEAFQEAVYSMAGDARLRQRLGQEARKLYQHHFDWEQMALRLLATLEAT